MDKQFFIIIFFLSFFCVFSQERYNTRSVTWIDTKDGLKQNSVKSCIEDNNGMLWLATEMGLYRYDGKVLKLFKDPNYPTIDKQRIHLAKDSKTGDIVFSVTPEDAIYTIHNNKLHRLFINKEASLRITFLTESGNYYSTDDPLINKVFQYNNKFKVEKGIQHIIIGRMCVMDSAAYVSNFDSLYVFRRNDKTFRLGYKGSIFTTLMPFGSKLVILDKKKANLFDTHKKIIIPIQTDAVLQEYVNTVSGTLFNNSANNSFVYEYDKNYYFYYKGNVYRINYVNNRLVSEFLFKNPSDELSSLSYNKKDNLFFVGTSTKGLMVIKPINFNTLNFDKFQLNSTYSVAQSDKDTWSSASGWNYNKSTNRLTINKSADVWFLLFYKGAYYYCQYDYDTYKYDLVDIKNSKNKNPFRLKLDGGNFNGFCYLNDTLWISSDSELFYKENNALITDDFFGKYIINNEIQKLVAFKNKILVATVKGLLIYDPKNKKVTTLKGLENVYARYIKIIDDTSYWVGCYGDGLFLVHNNKVIKVRDENIDITSAHAIEEDKEGNLWISTNDGLFCMNKKESMEKILQNKKISVYKYTIDDGLLTNEFNGGGTYPSLNDSTGIIGFPCMKGFTWFRPEAVPKHLFTGKIIIDEVKADGLEIQSKNDMYRFSENVNIVNIDFSYPYYFSRENLTVEYCFSFDKHWKKVKGNSITFARPKKGAFKILFRIHTHGFNKSKDVVEAFNMQFEPKYYETTWFILLISGGVTLVIFISFKIGSLLSKEREKALQQKVDEKTIELQETLSDLRGAKKIVEKSLLEKDILLKEIHHRVKNNLQLVITLLSYQSSKFKNKELNDFLESGTGRIVSMALIHESLYQTDNLGRINFKEYAESLIKNIISSMADEEHVKFSMDIDEVTFDVKRAIPLGLILNELVVNTIKHNYTLGDELHFNLDLKKVKSHYKVTYNDPQSTMTQEDTKKSSFGLELIHLLAAQLKGKSMLTFTEGLTAIIEF